MYMQTNHALSTHIAYIEHALSSFSVRSASHKTSEAGDNLEKSVCFLAESKHIAPCAGIFKQSMGARNRVGIGLSYQPGRLHVLAELIPWNRFLGSLKV
jgi:hypothetical protein